MEQLGLNPDTEEGFKEVMFYFPASTPDNYKQEVKDLIDFKRDYASRMMVPVIAVAL